MASKIHITKDNFNADKTDDWARLRRKVSKLAPAETPAQARSRHGRKART